MGWSYANTWRNTNKHLNAKYCGKKGRGTKKNIHKTDMYISINADKHETKDSSNIGNYEMEQSGSTTASLKVLNT